MAKARLGQHLLEVLVPSDTASPTTVTGAGVSQHVVEVLGAFPSKVRASQYVMEVLMVEDGAQTDPSEGGGGEPGAAGTRSFGWAG